MRKTGFTLAEILITLGVIGIVAAITLPGLNSNVNTRKVGPALAKAVNTLENANHTALMEESENTLDGITLTYESEPNDYLNRIAKYLSGEYAGEENITPTKGVEAKNLPVFRAKDGIMYIASTTGTSGDYCAGSGCGTGNKGLVNHYVSPYFDINGTGLSGEIKFPNKKYHGNFFPVIIDINGDKKPNEYSKDRFLVFVDFYGIVIPAGGQESVDYGTDKNLIICTAANSSGSARCTGSIADNGWEVRY